MLSSLLQHLWNVKPRPVSDLRPLEQLPVEILRDIGDKLTFFVTMSLSQASKQCYRLLGPFECPDRLSWIIYLYLLMKRNPIHKEIFLGPPSISLQVRAFLPSNDLYKFYTRSRRHLSLESLWIEIHKFDARMHRHCEQIPPVGYRWHQDHFLQLPVPGLPLDDDVDHEPLLDEYFNNATRDSPDIGEHYRPSDRLVYMGGVAFCYLDTLQKLCKDKLCHASGRKKHFWEALASQVDGRKMFLDFNETVVAHGG